MLRVDGVRLALAGVIAVAVAIRVAMAASPSMPLDGDEAITGIMATRILRGDLPLFFGVQNVTNSSEWSNYTAASPVPTNQGVVFSPSLASDPVAATSLYYENTQRLANMGSDYYSLVNPWYHAPVIPTETGYHMYSYSLDFINLDAMGSTNYGKLTNVSIAPEVSLGAQNAVQGLGGAGSGANYAQKFEFIVTCVNNNIIRISGGALGFPVL
jgi:hypothetical protein